MRYALPEVVEGLPYSRYADVWALALIYVMVTGRNLEDVLRAEKYVQLIITVICIEKSLDQLVDLLCKGIFGRRKELSDGTFACSAFETKHHIFDKK